jgi:multimeric flavodoxin WrbA
LLLLVTRSRSGKTRQLTEAILEGIAEAGVTYEVRHRDAFDAVASDVLEAKGVLIGTPARFGYMSGALKDFFERVYFECLPHTVGLPWALYVKGDTDTSGAVYSVERIAKGLQWNRVLPVLEVVGDTDDSDLEAARELGGAMAAGLDLGIF